MDGRVAQMRAENYIKILIRNLKQIFERNLPLFLPELLLP
jgi:hypothetical protein